MRLLRLPRPTGRCATLFCFAPAMQAMPTVPTAPMSALCVDCYAALFTNPNQCDATDDCPSVGPYVYLIHAVDGLACFCAMHAAVPGLPDTYVRGGYYGVDVLLRTRPVPDASRECALYFPCPEADACRLSCTEGCSGARPAQLGDPNVVNFAGLLELLTYPDTPATDSE